MPLAAIIPAAKADVEVREMPAAPMEPGSVLLHTLFSEVCGTDVHLQQGRLEGVPYPLLPGHVSVGRVKQVADNDGKSPVRDVDGNPVNIGDVVTFLDVHETCGHCWYCLVAHATTRCPSRKVYGITYGADDGMLGGWCEEVYLKPGVKIIPLPKTLKPERLIAGGCALPTAIHAIDRAEIRLGDCVAVQGSGPVGINAAILAKLSGAQKVILLDTRDHRLAVGKELGIDETICLESPDKDHAADQVRALTGGRGVDVTIECTGAPPAVPAGMQMTRDGGRYVIVGHYTDGGTIPLNPHVDINRKHLEVRGCWGSDFSHFYRMVHVLDRFGDEIPGGGWDRIVSQSFRLNEMNEALAAVHDGTVVKALVQPNAT